MRLRAFLIAFGLALFSRLVAAAAPSELYTSLTEQFDRFAAQTANLPTQQRAALFRRKFDRLFPGYYEPRGRKDYDQTVAKALADFPSIATAYRQVEREFPAAFNRALAKFRTFYPGFSSPLPIWFVHSLGESDGGTREIRKHDVAVFGADMIAKYDADRLQPFFDHEVLHLEHARYFPDCDPLWCSVWQEGLAVYAASKMNPGATDHQLLLTEPKPIRRQVDQHWNEALCLTQERSDSVDSRDLREFLFLDGGTPDLPPRFGYYMGYRIMQHAGQSYSLVALTRLNHQAAHALLKDTLLRMMTETHVVCKRRH